MAGKTTPWWRDVLTRAVRGIRAGVAAFFRPPKKPADLPANSPNQEDIPEEEADLTDHSPQPSPGQTSPDGDRASDVEKQTAPEVSGRAPAPEEVSEEAPEQVVAAPAQELNQVFNIETLEAVSETGDATAEGGAGEAPESPADLLAEAALGIDAAPDETEADEPAAQEQPQQPHEEPPPFAAAREDLPVESVEVIPEEESFEPEPVNAPEPEGAPEAVETPASAPEPEPPVAPEHDPGDVPESPADLLAEVMLPEQAPEPATDAENAEEMAAEVESPEEPTQASDSAHDKITAAGIAGEETVTDVPVVASTGETAPELAETEAPEPDLGPETPAADEGAGDIPESPADLLAELALGIDMAASPDETELPENQTVVTELAETAVDAASAEQPQAIASAQHEEAATAAPEVAPESSEVAAEAPAETAEAPEAIAPAEPQQPRPAPLPQAAAPAPPAVPHEPIKREEGPDTSPVSVFVNQVYEGPFDLLLDLIRKQDIDIYDIPIAKITAQFLAYVNQLKASDMDVAGEFIYTASLLIHIKSKMLLPREPKGGDDGQEDPRRELVERLLEHERFKNAAQMLQQKQMLEAATWTNPGVREFREQAGEAEIGPEIAADTTDLVRVFRTILERARSRPIINVQEDSVTVGQMIQFLGRRLTMEDKPVALHKLLAHTKSERALIAMFLALLELVRLQAILLRQDRHFSEIFIKKNSGFEGVMNQGMALDDWQ